MREKNYNEKDIYYKKDENLSKKSKEPISFVRLKPIKKNKYN